MQIIAESDTGYLGFEGNELTIGSKVDDPPKLRVTSPLTEHGGGGGVISFNASRQPGVCDGHNQIEMGMIRVEQSEDVRGQTGNPKGEFNFLLNDGGQGDANMQKPLAFIWNRLTRWLFPTSASAVSHMTSPQGRYQTHQQEDGNFVTYDTSTTPWTAIWSAWTGVIQ